jgi:hypothetical protein
MRDQTEKDYLITILLNLGKTSSEIASNLNLLNITGHKMICKTCPLAIYLLENSIDIGTGIYARQGRYAFLQIDSKMYSIDTYSELQGVIDFVLDHDAGLYPFLIP